MIFKKVMVSNIAEMVGGTKADFRMASRRASGSISGQTALNLEAIGLTIASRAMAHIPHWMDGLIEVGGMPPRCMVEACTFGQMGVNSQAITRPIGSTA